MTRFLHWRKMTWAILAWTAVMGVLLVRGIAAAAPACENGFGASSEFLTKQECVTAAGAGFGVLGIVVMVAGWLFGLALLTLIWFATRPLWRQGHGARLRRLQSADVGWVPRDLSRLTTPGSDK